MKNRRKVKLIKKFTFILIILNLLFIFSNSSFAADPVPGENFDQSASDTGQNLGYLIDNNPNMIQTFKTTKEQLTRVDIFLKDRKIGSKLNLKILPFKDQTEILSNSPIIEKTITLEPIQPSTPDTFVFDYPYPKLKIGNYYGIKLSVNDNQTRWFYGKGENEFSGYLDGAFLVNTELFLDAAFITYGRNFLDIPRQPSGSGGLFNNKKDGTSVTLAPIGENVTVPRLSSLDAGGKKIDLPAKGLITLYKTDKLKLSGNTNSGNQIYIINGSNIFPVESGQDGVWTTEIEGINLITDDIWAQTVTKDGRGSPVVYLFSLGVEDPPKQKNNLSIFGGIGKQWIILFGAFFIIMIIFGIIYLFISKRNYSYSEQGAYSIKPPQKKEVRNEDMPPIVAKTGDELTPENINDKANK